MCNQLSGSVNKDMKFKKLGFALKVSAERGLYLANYHIQKMLALFVSRFKLHNQQESDPTYVGRLNRLRSFRYL